MRETYEEHLLARYALKVVDGRRLASSCYGEVCGWLADEAESLGLSTEAEASLASFQDTSGTVERKQQFNAIAKSLVSCLGDMTEDHWTRPKGPLEDNLAALARELELDSLERQIFGLIVRYHLNKAVGNLCQAVTRKSMMPEEVVALVLDTHKKEVVSRVGSGSRLVQSGLLKAGLSRHLADFFEVPDAVLLSLQKAGGSMAEIREIILGSPCEPELNWDDFAHLGDPAAQLARFLQNVSERRISGVNILLYGPPGTGKTEFCKSLAKNLGLNLFAVGERDEEGDEPSRHGRLSGYRVAQNLLRYQKGALLLFDEMEDLFGEHRLFLGSPTFKDGSKVFAHRLLENNPVPTIWTINDLDLINSSIVRRMAFALEVKCPAFRERGRVWARILERHHVEATPADLEGLARLQDISPAVVNSAAHFASLTQGSAEDVQVVTRSIVRAMQGGRETVKIETQESPFLPELAHADMDLPLLESRLASPQSSRAISLCLYGPSGTGKSAYLRHLARQMGMEVLYKRASDLLGSLVGESERNIAQAFEQAREEGLFLIFDEADSLLADRRNAHHPWEVSQVNEMLTWMESHPLPFACTTNLMSHLDQASLRRFLFKVKFGYLDMVRIAMAFEHFFTEQAPERLLRCRNLTAGDFALAKKKADLLGLGGSATDVAEMILQESSLKEEAGNALGFCTH